MKTRTRHVVCWIEPYFDLIDVATFCHVLSVAGSNWNWRPYRLSLASQLGGLVTSRSQVSLLTVPLTACDAPDVVILGPGELERELDGQDALFASWREADPVWVTLSNSTSTLLRLNLPTSTLAVSASRQAQVQSLAPHIELAAKDFHFDAQVLSCSTLDVLPAALALIERQIGRSARRFVETQMGLTSNTLDVAGIDLRGLGKVGP